MGATECTHCGVGLDEEEANSPAVDSDGDVICDECDTRLNWDNCSRCGELVMNAGLKTEPGSLIVMMEQTDEDLPTGYYRVLRWPFFADGMVTAFFFSNALQRIAPLDTDGERAARECWTAAGPMCSCCQKAVESALRIPKDN